MAQHMKHVCSVALVVLAAGSGLAGAGVSSSLIWDDFDSDPNGYFGGAAVHTATIFNDPFAQGASFSLDTLFSSPGDTGAVFFNSGIGAQQGASILYNDLGDQPGSSMNFAAIGAQSFEVDFLSSDQAFDLEVILSGGGGVAFGVVSVPAGMGYTASIQIADLIISPNFDITDVSDVTFNLNLEDSAVASLDFVATEIRLIVPTPASTALLGIGGIMMVRRKR